LKWAKLVQYLSFCEVVRQNGSFASGAHQDGAEFAVLDLHGCAHPKNFLSKNSKITKASEHWL